MTGVKGKSGGPRTGAGRRATTTPVSSLRLSTQAQQELAIITLNQRGIRNNPRLSQRQVVEELIHAAWLEYDAMIQHLTEQAQELNL